ncbi:MAG: RNA polymerase factor sigma-54 [Xanthomonadales bacterium]|nr:RNA polymerase factor sigma-54 [Xanthomonadales bacterium]
MRAGLELRLGQQLRLSPQLRQALKLLQMSQAELEIELREQVESNPVLDLFEGDASGGPEEPAAPAAAEGTSAPAADPAPTGEAADTGGEDGYEADLDYSPEPGEGDWGGGGRGGDAEGDPVDWAAAPADDLCAHLLWQLQLSPASDRDRAIAVALIESLDTDGYLRVDLEEIQATLAPDLQVSDAEIEAVRHRLQRFDPVGVASRDLRDCLLVQIDSLPDREDPVTLAARRLVDQHLERLPRTDRAQLARLADCDETTLAAALDLIRSLDPKPGGRLDTSTPEYVQPDVYAVRENGRWRVVLASDQGHDLRINRDYLRMAREAGREARSYLRGCLQEARWLLRALAQRQDTLYRVASAIVRAQEAFLEQGPQAMRPLMLKDIAAELDIHESTVSRTVARKYLHTPRGVFELRHFFSTGYAGGEDGDAAATAVRALIGELIAAEDAARPLSDQALAGLLKQRGLNVARRTVAKYREQLRLAPSHERRRAG